MSNKTQTKMLEGKRAIDVFAVGTLNVDIIAIGQAPHDIEKLNNWVAVSQIGITPAGSIGYPATDLARLGLKVAMYSYVASDPLGEYILNSLKEQSVDTGAVAAEKNTASGIGIYMLLFGSRKRPLTGRLATHSPWPKTLSRAAEKKLKNAQLLHCGGYLHYPDRWGRPTELLYRKAKQYGLVTSIDPQFPLSEIERPWLKHFGNLLKYVDIIFTDETEAQALTGETKLANAAQRLLEEGPELVVVKQGNKGALLQTKTETIHQPAFSVRQIMDSIGAGDAFDAGVIFGILKGYNLKDTARFASAVAAMTLKGMGGTSTAPTLAQVKAYLKKTR